MVKKTMKQYKLFPVEDEKLWNAALVGFDNFHLLQSWQWGEIKAMHGWQPNRFLVKEKDKYIAGFQLLTRKIHPLVPITIGYTPRGPFFDIDSVDLDRLLYTVETVAKNRNCAYVKVDADLEETSPGGIKWTAALKQNNWRFSPQQPQMKNTGITDLLPDDPKGEEKLLAAMKKTWRYNTRSSVRRGVSVRRGNAKDIAKFYALYKETGTRHRFSIRSSEYYKEVYRAFSGGGLSDSLILLAEHSQEEEPLGSAIFVKFGDKCWYLFAASSDKRRADMPNYPLQWEALKWARSTGAKVYDWGGASSNPDDPNDSMAQVWHYKKGFGAKFFSGTGAWDKPFNTPQWVILHMLNRLRKLARR